MRRSNEIARIAEARRAHCAAGNALEFYSGGTAVLVSARLSVVLLAVFHVFLSSSTRMRGRYLELGHNHLPYPYLFTIHDRLSVCIQRCVTSCSLNSVVIQLNYALCGRQV